MTQRILEEAKQRLREVEDGIATMQAKYRECIAKKEELELKCDQCEQRLSRADKVCASRQGPEGPGQGFWVVLATSGAAVGRASPHPQHPRASRGATSAAHQRTGGREGALAGDGGEPGQHA